MEQNENEWNWNSNLQYTQKLTQGGLKAWI